MLTTLLVAVGIGLSVLVYFPAWARILRRKSTGDFSLWAQTLGLIGCYNGLVLAILTKTGPWLVLAAITTVFATFSTILVYRYHKC